MGRLFNKLDAVLAIAAVIYPLYHWYQVGSPMGRWTINDFIHLAILILGVLYILVRKIAD
jgi:hypothetical protein